jgi:quinol monooxygenase YgiN
MILIVVKFQVRPDRRDDWRAFSTRFAEAVRQEPGNISFDWYTHDENPDEVVLVEEFESPEAGEVHVGTDHFRTAMAELPDLIAETPKIVNFDLPGDGWSEMAELAKKPSR